MRDINERGLNELALFAGAGGGILGGKLIGWRTVCAVEIDAYAASVLMQRQNEGILPPFPIWDDVRTFDGRPWRGIVDVVSGGFPCQDISIAGRGGVSMEHEAACGQKWQESLVKYDRDSHSWKTRQYSLLGGLIEFLGTWPRWGMIRDGELYQQKTPRLYTREKGYGLFPTPVGMYTRENWPMEKIKATQKLVKEKTNAKGKHRTGNGFGLNLAQVVRMFPTPCARDKRTFKGAQHPKGWIGKECLVVQIGGTLNPMWVEWLMGWPLGWTDLKPLGMDKFRQWLNSHGKY